MPRFLIPVDGSEPNEAAVKELRRYLGWMKDEVELHLINVQPRIPYGNRVSSVIGRETIARYQQEDGLAALKPARKVLDQSNIPYQYHVGVGEPAEVIVQYATKKRCDEIVMGTSGVGSLKGRVLGSVAAKVVELSPVPVMLIRKRSPRSR